MLWGHLETEDWLSDRFVEPLDVIDAQNVKDVFDGLLQGEIPLFLKLLNLLQLLSQFLFCFRIVLLARRDYSHVRALVLNRVQVVLRQLVGQLPPLTHVASELLGVATVKQVLLHLTYFSRKHLPQILPYFLFGAEYSD